MNVIKISDGLGNQMFQYAFARKLQLKSKKEVYLDTRFINHEDSYLRGETDYFHKNCDYRTYRLNFFKIRLPQADSSVMRRWKYLSKNTFVDKCIYNLSLMHLWPWKCIDESKYNNNLLEIKTKIWPIYYQGYFFDLSYYNDIRNILQREFRVKNPICIPKDLRSILSNNNTIGIHVRKGDFTKLSRDISQTDYYTKALKKMEEYVENPTYLVFSDDIEWVKKNMVINGRKVYISAMGFKDYEELTIMKYCKHNIIANSTFSYWAAYLNDNLNKIVICPKRWKTNIIPKDWIRL